jgi:DNA-binding SARP family transcriptional activator/ATP/maltotriose-dependent transcriptional regulator MalT
MALPQVLSRPPRIPGAVPRDRLESVAADCAGVLLVAPAGSGKTVLAARLATARPRTAWARMAPGYDSAVDLVGLAAASLGLEGPAGATSLLDLAGEVLAMLEPEPTTLVIDDYQLARGEECDPLVAEVLPLVPPGSLVVLCTRVRPPGLLGRVADGLLRVVTGDDLAFTEEEAAVLFDGRGAGTATAATACARVGGWAAGLVLAAEAGGGSDAAADRLVTQVLIDDASEGERPVVDALAVLPYLTDAIAAGLGLAPAAMRALTERTMLVTEDSGYWRMAELARDAVEPGLDDAVVHALRSQAAPLLEVADPAAAVDVLIANDEPQAAADTLARHLSAIGAQRAMHWLYKLPAELRRQFPPVLAAGRATVDLDEAVALAQARLDAAPNDDARRESLFALGSAHAHAGELASAAAALEAAVAPGAHATLAARGHAWLGVVRWWAGDLVGAEAALAAAGDDVLAHWARAETALARGDLDTAEVHGQAARRAAGLLDADLTDAPGLAVLARVALGRGDVAVARGQAAAAYRAAAEADGLDLAAAAPVHAWLLVAAGELDEAAAVMDLVNRRIGRHDIYAQLHVHLVRAAVATARGDREAEVQAETAIHAIRQSGFAVVEAQARAALTPLAGRDDPGLLVGVLGPSTLEAGGASLAPGEWKSQKAVEVLQFLALAGERGAHREEVIEAVWPDRDPQKGRMLLRAALSEIRRRLEPDRQAGEPSRFLHTTGERVRVDATTDLDRARALARDGRPSEALALFRGDLLADNPYVEWAFEERRAAEHLRTELAERVAGDEAASRPDRAAALEVLLVAEPWREELYDRLAALHRAAGDEAAARAAERRRDDAG